MYPAEKVSLSLEEQHANGIWINFLGQDLLVQAVWGSEEGGEARVWPGLLAVTHVPRLGGQHGAAGRAGGAVPHSPAPTLHPWLCHTAPFVPWVPLSFLSVHTFGVPMWHTTGGGCPGSPAVLLLPRSITIITAQIITAQKGSLSTQGRHLTLVLQFGTSVTPSASKLPGSYQHHKFTPGQ